MYNIVIGRFNCELCVTKQHYLHTICKLYCHLSYMWLILVILLTYTVFLTLNLWMKSTIYQMCTQSVSRCMRMHGFILHLSMACRHFFKASLALEKDLEKHLKFEQLFRKKYAIHFVICIHRIRHAYKNIDVQL